MRTAAARTTAERLMDELENGPLPFSTGAFEEQHTAEAYIGFTLGRLHVAAATERRVSTQSSI